jgi:hypothetical protein
VSRPPSPTALRGGSRPEVHLLMAAPRVVLILLAGALAGCTSRTSPPAPAPAPAPIRFSDGLKGNGIDFEHQDGFDGVHYRIVETINGGVALLDYDGDGRLDIYFTNGARSDPGRPPARDALYQNHGNGKFLDVTERTGLGDELMSLGVAVADYDGDGDPDLFVTNLGPNRLYRNDAGAAFREVAGEAGLAGDEGMHSGCAFLDMDRDGDLDLYVASYVIDRKTGQEPCRIRGIPSYCPPLDYPAAPDHLYENLGDGRFRDVSESSGIRSVEPGRGLGVLSADFNDDGFPDIFVANDRSANFMFLGDGRGRFADAAVHNGTAYGDEGTEMGSMGVDAADFDGDGLLDLCVTNYQDQINNLYRAVRGGEFYEERARLAGIAAGPHFEVSWGVGFADLDQDGLPDLFISNGHLNREAQRIDSSTSYAQKNRLFRNLGGGRFEEAGAGAGEPFGRAGVYRGAAFGDLDNDGDLDLVVVSAVGAPLVLLNEGNRNHFALVKLEGAGKNRDAIGARVTLTAGGRRQVAERRSSGSYLSANDPRLHFGLGGAERIESIEVRWPDGRSEVHRGLPADRLITLREGVEEAGVAVLTR